MVFNSVHYDHLVTVKTWWWLSDYGQHIYSIFVQTCKPWSINIYFDFKSCFALVSTKMILFLRYHRFLSAKPFSSFVPLILISSHSNGKLLGMMLSILDASQHEPKLGNKGTQIWKKKRTMQWKTLRHQPLRFLMRLQAQRIQHTPKCVFCTLEVCFCCCIGAHEKPDVNGHLFSGLEGGILVSKWPPVCLLQSLAHSSSQQVWP